MREEEANNSTSQQEAGLNKKKRSGWKSLIPVVVMAVIGLIAAPIKLPEYTWQHGAWYVVILAAGYVVSHFFLEWPNTKRGKVIHDVFCVLIAAGICFLMCELAYLPTFKEVIMCEGKTRLSQCLMCYLEILIAMVLFSLVTRRLRRGCQIVFGLVAFTAFVNSAVYTMRAGVPLAPTDLINIRTGLGMANGSLGLNLSPGILCAVGLLYCGVSFTYRIHQQPKKLLAAKDKKVRLGANIAWVVATLLVLWGAYEGCGYLYQNTQFFQKAFDYEKVSWSPHLNIRQNGYVAIFLDNLTSVVVHAPAGYSQQMLLDHVSQELLGQTGMTEEELVAALANQLAGTSAVKPNIVMIQNETLVDFESTFARGTYSEEVMPFLHSLYESEDALTGFTRVSVLGGSTIVTEWGALTGNASWYVPSAAPYQELVHSGVPTLATKLADQGYTCEVIHPSDGSDYGRDYFFPRMGFEEFFDQDAFVVPDDLYGPYISDEASYNMVLERLREAQDPAFIFDITMQDHFPYGDQDPEYQSVYMNEYPDVPTFSVYLTRVRESDRAFQAFIENIMALDEPTVVMMYGDHGPRIYSGELNDFIAAPEEGESEIHASQRFYTTPLVLWSNYGLDGGDLGRVSNNYLASLILQYAGVETTPYDLYLLKLMEQTPVITSSVYEYADGECHDWDEMPKLEPALVGYQALQYNMIYDRKHRVEELFAVPDAAKGSQGNE